MGFRSFDPEDYGVVIGGDLGKIRGAGQVAVGAAPGGQRGGGGKAGKNRGYGPSGDVRGLEPPGKNTGCA
ncbi:hypothetical protein B1F70_04420, partial [Pseudomonas syringae]